MLESQAERMESELATLRELFDDARINGDAPRMIQLSRVIVLQEKEIAKQRKEEGLVIDAGQFFALVDDLSSTATAVARRLLPPDLFNAYTDELTAELQKVWDGRRGISTHEAAGTAGGSG